MNKSKRLRLERQVLKNERLILEIEKLRFERMKLIEEMLSIGQEVDEELKQRVVV